MTKSKKHEEEVPQISNLDLRYIEPNEHNPRKSFPETAMNELIESVREKGILQPIIVRPWENGFQLVAGERRWRAASAIAKNAGGPYSIPAIVLDLNDTEVKEVQIIENIQRAEMHPMEEAEAFFELKKNKNTPEEIASKVGKSVYYVRQRLKLTDLRYKWPEAYKAGHVKHKDALLLSTLPADIQVDLYNNKFEYRYEGSMFELSDYLLRQYECDLKSANFKLDVKYGDLQICNTCPFNSACNSLFPDDESKAHCTNKRCYDLKVKLAFEQDLADAKEDPGTVLITTGAMIGTENKQLQQDGLEVYKDSDFKVVEAPDPDDYDFEDEDYAEDERKRYEKDQAEYQEKIQDPTLLKALVMDGFYQGDTVYGFLDKKSTPVTGSGDDEGYDPSSDINNEISRIKTRETRSKQLDDEKIWTRITELVATNDKRKIMFNLQPLSQEEMDAAGHVLQDKVGWDKRSWITNFNKWWGCGKNVTEEQLYGLLRMLIVSSLVHIGQPHTTKGSGASYVYPILKNYFPEEVQAIEASQKEIADKRGDRVNQKLKALKKKLEKAKAKA